MDRAVLAPIRQVSPVPLIPPITARASIRGTSPLPAGKDGRILAGDRLENPDGCSRIKGAHELLASGANLAAQGMPARRSLAGDAENLTSVTAAGLQQLPHLQVPRRVVHSARRAAKAFGGRAA
jgi:hypothetical protein